MPNERLQLSVDLTTTGESSANALSASLQRVVDIATKSKAVISAPSNTGFEGFPEKLQQFVEAPIQSAQSTIAEFSKGFGAVGIAAAGAIGLLSTFAASSYEASKALGELGVQNQRLSIVTGLSTREVGLYSFAAKAAGSDIGVLEGTVRKLSQGLADGGVEGKKVADALSAAGISTRSLNGDILPMGQIFTQIGEAMQHMSGAAERNAFAVKALGRAGLEAVPMLMGLKENLADADKIGLGISDSEQTAFLDIYKKKIEEVDGAWSVAMRHFKEGIAGTIWMDISGAGAAAFNYLATGGAIAGDKGKHTPIDPKDLKAPAWQTSIQGVGSGIMAAPTDWSKVSPADSLDAIVNGWGPGGDPVVAAFLARQTKEGISANIEKLRGDNNASMATLNAKGPGAGAKQQAVDSINANERKIASLEAQLKRIEELTSGIAAAKAKGDEAVMSAGLGSISGVARLIAEQDALIAKGASASQASEIRKSYAPQIANKLAEEEEAQRKFTLNAGSGYKFQSSMDKMTRPDELTGMSELDRANSQIADRTIRTFIANLEDVRKPIIAGDENSIRNSADIANRSIKGLSIGAKPEDEISIARQTLAIRQGEIDADKSLLESHKDAYGTEEQRVELARRLNDLDQQSYNATYEYFDKLRDYTTKQEEQFKSISGGLFDAMLGGGKGVSSFFKSQAEGIGKTIFQNIAQFSQTAIMGDGTAAHPGIIPHAAANTTLGKILNETPFGPNPMASAGTTLTTAGQNLIQAASDLSNIARGGSGGSYDATGNWIPGSLPYSSVSSASNWLPNGGAPLPYVSDAAVAPLPYISSAVAPMPYSGSTDADGNWVPGTANYSTSAGVPSSQSSRPMIGTTSGDLMAGAAVIGGTIAAIKGFAGSGSGGVQGKLDGAAGIAASASTVLSMVSGVASSIPIVGSIVAAALPLIGALFPNGPAHRENQIEHELTNSTYQAPTALNEQMSTSGTYQDRDFRGNLRGSNFSATPTVTDPHIYWAVGNNPVQAPGRVTSPYGAPVTPSAPIIQHVYQAGAIQTIDAGSFSDLVQRSSAAVGDAVTAHLQSGPTRLSQVIRYGN